MNSRLARLRRSFRISLRGLLVLVAAVAVWLGLVCNRARNQRIAVDRIMALGGSVRYDFEFGSDGALIKDATPPGWLWLRRLVGDEYFQRVVNVGLKESKVTDSDLQAIGRLRRVRRLNLCGTDVSDAGVAHCSQLTQLRTLWLSGTSVTDVGLKHIANLRNLTNLSLKRTGITDAGLKHVAGLRTLISFDLDDTHITDAGLRHLSDLRDLRGLGLDGTAITGDGLKHLSHLTELRSVRVRRTSVTSDGISHLANLEELIWLQASDTLLDDSAVPHFAQMDARLKSLLIERCPFSAQGLSDLERTLPSCCIGSDALVLRGHTKYKTRWKRIVEQMYEWDREKNRMKLIDLSDTGMLDEDVAALHGLRNVEMIDLRGTNVSDRACEQLRSALPGCQVCR